VPSIVPFLSTYTNRLGFNNKGKPLRNRRYWHCKHCNELQFSSANSSNKEAHLLNVHNISKHGNRVPKNTLAFKNAIEASAESTTPSTTSTIRQAEGFGNLAVNVLVEPFKKTLIAFLVICHMPFSLVGNLIFLEFLKILFPAIEKLMPCSTTVREWIMDAFKDKREDLKKYLARSQSMIHFSFDLWTSPNHLALLGIVAHFVDEYGQNQSVSAFMLSLSSMPLTFRTSLHPLYLLHFVQ
jgi:hypothetical protein